MGKTITPKYKIVFRATCGLTPCAWRCNIDGRPTDRNLEKYIKALEDSCLPGGINAHLGPIVVWKAEIKYNHEFGSTVAAYTGPKFAVI